MAENKTNAQVESASEFIDNNSNVYAKLIANGCNMEVLRTNSVLQKDEWIELDQRVVQVARERLTVVDDLITSGLTLNMGGIGTVISQYQIESDMSPATVNMEADSEMDMDILNYNYASVPIPIISKGFKIGIRQLEASRRMGSNIDFSNADVAARKVAEGMEDLVIKGYGKTFAGNRIYGYTTHPNRVTGVAIGSWTNIDNIYDTVLAMIASANKVNKFGPYILYVPGDQSVNLFKVYNDGSGQTVAQRLQNVSSIVNVRIADRLPSNNAVLVQTTSDTVDLAIAQALITVEWSNNGNLSTNYKVLTAIAPRIKADANGALGIVHYTGL